MALDDQLLAFVDAVNRRDAAAVRRTLSDEFFGYAAQGDEPTAPDAFGTIVEAVTAAFPDVRFAVTGPTMDGGEVRARMTATGTFTDTLWNLPGSGARHELSATVVGREIDGRIALRWEDVELIPTLRKIGIAPMPEDAHRRPAHTPRPPEIVQRLAFNGMRLGEKECAHLGLIQVTEPTADVCGQCEASGTEYPALRMCLVCGFVGCCDASTNKHAKKHMEDSGHPIFRSVAPGESWLWCYAESAFLSSRRLRGYD